MAGGRTALVRWDGGSGLLPERSQPKAAMRLLLNCDPPRILVGTSLAVGYFAIKLTVVVAWFVAIKLSVVLALKLTTEGYMEMHANYTW
jgi:hypothetical protein